MYSYQKDKVKGALYGIAIGDAMGVTTEFYPQHSIKKRYKKRTDIIGEGWLNLFPGEVTDPTEMAFCICEALAQTSAIRSTSKYKTAFLNQCCLNYTAWYDRRPFDIDSCVVDAIKNCRDQSYRKWIDYSYTSRNVQNSILFAVAPAIMSRHSLQLVMELSRLTHNSPDSEQAVKKFRQILIACLRNLEVTDKVFSQLPPRNRNIHHNLDSALYHLETTATFETAILEAVYHGGDTDGIAALTGCFAGAAYGYSTIPERWLLQLQPAVVKKLNFCTKAVLGQIFPEDSNSCA